MKVFVLSRGGTPLLPTTPRCARIFLKEVATGKNLAEGTPRKVVRIARPTQGFLITRASATE